MTESILDSGVAKAANQNSAKLSSAVLDITADADRKSTRLNSSHGYISYAVFCLKKKKKKETNKNKKKKNKKIKKTSRSEEHKYVTCERGYRCNKSSATGTCVAGRGVSVVLCRPTVVISGSS